MSSMQPTSRRERSAFSLALAAKGASSGAWICDTMPLRFSARMAVSGLSRTASLKGIAIELVDEGEGEHRQVADGLIELRSSFRRGFQVGEDAVPEDEGSGGLVATSPPAFSRPRPRSISEHRRVASPSRRRLSAGRRCRCNIRRSPSSPRGRGAGGGGAMQPGHFRATASTPMPAIVAARGSVEAAWAWNLALREL